MKKRSKEAVETDVSPATVTAEKSLARRYRPVSVLGLIGQPKIVTAWRGLIANGKLPQAILCAGPSGTGKTTFARIVAATANCAKLVKGNPCGTCDSCRQIRADNSSDVTEINAADARGIDDMRSLMKRMLNLPMNGRHRVFIIDEAHQITADAQKALLKPIEEPRGHVIIILCSTDPQKIIHPILTRLKQFVFEPMKPQIVADDLLAHVAQKEGWKIPEEVLLRIADAADSIPRVALDILDNVGSSIKLGKKGNFDRVLTNAIADAGYVSPQKVATKLTSAMRDGKTAALFEAFVGVDRVDLVLEQVHRMLFQAIRTKLKAGGIDQMANGLEKLPFQPLQFLLSETYLALKLIRDGGGFSNMNEFTVQSYLARIAEIVAAENKNKK